jgi:hypothetical protein
MEPSSSSILAQSIDEQEVELLQLYLQEQLALIPEKYTKEDFNPIPSIVEVLQHEAPEEKTEEIEQHFDRMETAMYALVDGMKL